MIALFLSFSVLIQNAFAAIVHTLLFRFGSVHEWPLRKSIPPPTAAAVTIGDLSRQCSLLAAECQVEWLWELLIRTGATLRRIHNFQKTSPRRFITPWEFRKPLSGKMT